MKKYIAMMIAAALILAVSGCAQKTAANTSAEEENSREQSAAQPAVGDEDAYATGDWNTSGLSRKQIDSIDWNLNAYAKYFRVDSGGATFHYWNLDTCLGILTDGDILYMSPGSTIIIDAESGESYETEGSFFAGMMPHVEGEGMDMPIVPIAPDETNDFSLNLNSESGMYVFVFDLGESVNEYFINSDLVCVGWTVTTDDGSVTYYLGEDPGFENVADEIMPEGAPKFEAP